MNSLQCLCRKTQLLTPCNFATANSKKKLTLTVSVHAIDDNKKRSSSKTSHDHTLETKLLDIIKKAYPNLDPAKHVVVLPVPVRPVIFSKNAPLADVKKTLPTFVPPMQIPKPKPLPKAHSSLPMKPAWLSETQPEEPAATPAIKPEVEAPVEPPPRRELPKAGPREVWLVDVADTLKDALKGTSILEWPEFEIWREEVAREEVEAERMEYAERRKVFDRDDWKRKREAEGDSDGDDRNIAKKSLSQDDGEDGQSDSDSSSSISSSSDDDDDTDFSEDMDGTAIVTVASEPIHVEAGAMATTETVLPGEDALGAVQRLSELKNSVA